MIRNIIFDMGGILYSYRMENIWARFREIGLEHPEDYFDPYRQRGFAGGLESGALDEEDFAAEVSKAAGKPVSLEQCRYGILGFVEYAPDWSFDCVDALHRQGYRTILFSNTNSFVVKHMSQPIFGTCRKGLPQLFDAMYVSHEQKMMKPEPEFIKKIVEEQGLVPEETLYVDDSAANLEPAKALGIRTFCPINGEDWTQEILRYLD